MKNMEMKYCVAVISLKDQFGCTHILAMEGFFCRNNDYYSTTSVNVVEMKDS